MTIWFQGYCEIYQKVCLKRQFDKYFAHCNVYGFESMKNLYLKQTHSIQRHLIKLISVYLKMKNSNICVHIKLQK